MKALKNSIYGFITAALLLSQSIAFAQHYDQTKDLITDKDQLVLLGKGLTPRDNKDLTLFFSCVGENHRCSKIRAVMLNRKTLTANWVGPEKTLITDEEIKKYDDESQFRNLINKRIKKIAKQFHHFNGNGERYERGIFYGMIFAALGIPKILFTVGIGVTVGFFVPYFFAALGVGSIVMIIAGTNSLQLGASPKISHTFQNQDGWNWSVQSKKIKSKMFWDYFNFIQKGYPVAQ